MISIHPADVLPIVRTAIYLVVILSLCRRLWYEWRARRRFDLAILGIALGTFGGGFLMLIVNAATDIPRTDLDWLSTGSWVIGGTLVILEELRRRGLSFRFHTPNGLLARLITREVARGLKLARFTTLRLGVETTALGEGRLDRKLREGELEVALANLKEAGFRRQEMGVYLMVGLPGQPEAEVAASIRRVQELGATPVLAQYSPIPGTALWPEAVRHSRYDLEREPLCHNNSIFPCLPQFSYEPHTRLKRLAAG